MAADVDQSEKLKLLKLQVKHAPTESGVYLMKNGKGDVLYVGKAKNLKNRLRTYFAGGDGRYQIEFLLGKVSSFETIVTPDEDQAFLLERDLISRLKPRYNILLKDDKSYLSIRIDDRAEWPRLELVRRPKRDSATYYGPYAYSRELRNLLEVINKVVPLRTCSDSVLYNRQRPCLEYEINRCCAPCCLSVDEDEYRQYIRQAKLILQGKTSGIIKQLEALMEKASEELLFEQAAAWRDRIEVLEQFRAGHSLVSFRGEDRDVFGIARNGEATSLCVLIVRGGRIAETKSFYLPEISLTDDQLLEGMVQEFYKGSREIPPEILLPYDFENRDILLKALSVQCDYQIQSAVPQRGAKFRLINMAMLNAKYALEHALGQEASWDIISTSLQQRFGLRQAPRRVECVDISNFQGSDVVGAIVVFFDGAPQKDQYRKYKLEHFEEPNDYQAIYEVVRRRLRRAEAEGTLPDLLIIDGGKGQLKMALKARDELGLTVDIVGLAKMRTKRQVQSAVVTKTPERVYVPGVTSPHLLEHGVPMSRFMSRIRDEVHRFVITFHRSRRTKRVFSNSLEEISGVSSEMTKRLLTEFKSTNEISKQNPEVIARVGRMPLTLARKIVISLQEKV